MSQHLSRLVSRRVATRVGMSFITALLVMVAFDAPVTAQKPPQYFVDEAKLPFDALTGTMTTRLWGVQGGAGYRIEVPANWNGDLVLYAHGFRGGGLELTVSNPPIRRYLIEHGYAWAASSYATNGSTSPRA